MKTLINLVVVLIVLLLTYCTSSEFTVFSHPDSVVEGKTNYGSTEFLVYQSPPMDASMVDVFIRFNCEKVASNAVYKMNIKYSGSNPFYFEYAELSSGGDILKLEPDRLPMRIQDGVKGIAEIISVPLQESVIENLLAFKDGELRLKGESVTIEFYLQSEFLTNLNKFYKETK